ncbi:MAG: hypothetical protein GY866_26365 [Proteobacteria bacterium]|nr:hypothetical protein [Pseudomonadota bacterium]
MNLRQQIQDFMKKKPGIALEELRKDLPDIKEGTLKWYFYKLKRESKDSSEDEKTSQEKRTKKADKKPPTAAVESTRQRVLKYLNENLDTTVGKLQEVFPEISKGTIRSYFYRWKRQGQKVGKPASKKAKKSVKRIKKALTPKKDAKELPAAGSDQELVEELKKVVSSQAETIAAMTKTIELLSGKEDSSEHKDLKGMTLDEIKKVAATYIRGLKDLPAKIRGK